MLLPFPSTTQQVKDVDTKTQVTILFRHARNSGPHVVLFKGSEYSLWERKTQMISQWKGRLALPIVVLQWMKELWNDSCSLRKLLNLLKSPALLSMTFNPAVVGGELISQLGSTDYEIPYHRSGLQNWLGVHFFLDDGQICICSQRSRVERNTRDIANQFFIKSTSGSFGGFTPHGGMSPDCRQALLGFLDLLSVPACLSKHILNKAFVC